MTRPARTRPIKRTRRANLQGTLRLRGEAGGGVWIAVYHDEHGRRVWRSTGTTDRALAERILAKRVADVALRREGIVDPREEALSLAGRQPVAQALGDYLAEVGARGRSAQHLADLRRHIESVAKGARWSRIGDIDAQTALRAVETMHGRKGDDGKARIASARTRAAYMRSLKSFTGWLTRDARLRADPLARLSLPSADTDRRMTRRMLHPDEWPWLRDATRQAPDANGMGGLERALLYATVLSTGLRLKEVCSLTKADLLLRGPVGHIRITPERTKNRKAAVIDMAPDLCEALAAHVQRKAPGARVFALASRHRAAAMLRDDLAAARAAWIAAGAHAKERAAREASAFLRVRDDAGEVLDFHALRLTMGNWLRLRGAHLTQMQRAMRHSTPTLTANTYGRTTGEERAHTAGLLAGLLEDEADRAMTITRSVR